MHELSLMEGVLSIIQEAQGQHGFNKVTRVVLEVGELAGAEREALDFCWEIIAKDTLADSAVLELIHVPAMAWCGQCDREVPIASRIDFCPSCGGIPDRIVRGLDLQVKTLDVEG
jgi:hydrogenase nickel incorporation protein HypA/HybF